MIYIWTYFIKTHLCSLSKDLSPEGDLRSLVKEKAAGGCRACKLFKWVLLSALVATVVEDADIVQRATADAVTVTIASLDFDFDEELSKRCTAG